ncbi:MAG: diguanylate cyclase, partial [Spirulinaceae cyanobacterium]
AARDAIARQVPDLVLLDIAFPNAPQGGLTLLEDLKQQYPQLPILIFSARDRLSDRAAICQTTFNPKNPHPNTFAPYPASVRSLPDLPIPGRGGGDAFLSKHITTSEVMATIAEMLKPSIPSTAKILIVDDDPITLENIQRLLSLWEFTPIPLSDPRLFWEMLETHAPDLLILDYKMPHYNGLQLCQVARNDPTWQGLPILFTTSETHPDTIQKIYQHGADDYLAKPFSEAELITRIFNRLERVQLLRSLAETDVLTGLTNRRRGSQDLNRYLRLCQRQEQMFSLILLDVDDFKPINDRYGHGVGDRVLRQLGIFLQQHFRQEDVVARWGGDEFIVGLYAMSKIKAQQRMKVLLNRMAATPLPIAGQVKLSLRLSFGVATYPDDGKDLLNLYGVADRELYRWKVKKSQTF